MRRLLALFGVIPEHMQPFWLDPFDGEHLTAETEGHQDRRDKRLAALGLATEGHQLASRETGLVEESEEELLISEEEIKKSDDDTLPPDDDTLQPEDNVLPPVLPRIVEPKKQGKWIPLVGALLVILIAVAFFIVFFLKSLR